MKTFLNYLFAVINVVASLLAIFGITIAPFFLDLTNPMITVPLAAMLLVVGMYLGYRLRERIADTEIKKELALKEYEDKKQKEEEERARLKKEESIRSRRINSFKVLDYDFKYLVGTIYAFGYHDYSTYEFENGLVELFPNEVSSYFEIETIKDGVRITLQKWVKDLLDENTYLLKCTIEDVDDESEAIEEME